jgi:hypothetical protein
MENCDICGRSIYGEPDKEFNPLKTYEQEDGIVVPDGVVCGGCLIQYIKNKKIERELERL